MPKAPKESINFTKGFAELEAIVADFESRELDLEKDIPKFERGLQLAAALQARLQEIENKVVASEQKFTSID